MKQRIIPAVFVLTACLSACGAEKTDVPSQPPVQYRLRQILIEPSVSPQREQSIKRAAETCLARARAGEDFTALAKELSEEPGASETGGNLGFFRREAMVKSFSDAVFAMKPGEIAGPVLTQFGYHIIKLHAVDGDSRHAQHILFMLTPGPEDSLKTLETLRTARRRILEGADFGAMVEEYVTLDAIRETEGYMVWQKPDDMLDSFRKAIQGLKEGDVSEPFVSIIGFHIVMVDSVNYDSDRLLDGFPAHIEKKLSPQTK